VELESLKMAGEGGPIETVGDGCRCEAYHHALIGRRTDAAWCALLCSVIRPLLSAIT
jgi:hypothetical protein